MKQFENKNGNFLVSTGVEVDTDDLIDKEETKQEKTLNQIKEKINKLAEKEEDDFVSKSTCLIHLYFIDNKVEKISGTLESYKKYCKTANLRGWREQRMWEAREIIFWAGYDTLTDYLKSSEHSYIDRISLEHIAGHEQEVVKEDRFHFGEFEIIEINGPLFKIKLELLIAI